MSDDKHQTLGEELWKLIEKWQGRAYISDAITEMDDDSVFEVAVAARKAALIQVKVLSRFVRKHNKDGTL